MRNELKILLTNTTGKTTSET